MVCQACKEVAHPYLLVCHQITYWIITFHWLISLWRESSEIPGELAYEIWANENDTIYINKTKNLAPEPDDANIIEIKLWNKGDGEE